MSDMTKWFLEVKGDEKGGNAQPTRPPRAHIRERAPVKPSERLAAIVVLITSRG